MKGILAQVNISPGGIPKTAVLFAHVSREGVAGDWQRNRKYHGGPDRAVCLFSEELYAELRDEAGIDMANGAVGENFTTRGVDLNGLSKGDQLRIGEACIIEITDVRIPCSTLKTWNARLPRLIEGRSGWLARVVVEGTVRPGDPIKIVRNLPSDQRNELKTEGKCHMSEPFELITDAQGKLTLRRPGQEDMTDVRIRRSFPWSKPGRYISVRSAEGKELMLIEDVDALGPVQRGAIEESLRASVLIPKITHIDHVDVRFGFQQWNVQTDRGPIEFRVQEREDIRFMNDGRFSIRDAEGNIYELAPLDKLDDHSRKAVESLI